MANSRLCSIPGCDKAAQKRAFCNAHYLRWYRHGDPLGGRTPWGEPMRWINEHVSYTGTDCLEWPFARFPTGYGNLYLPDGSHVQASRYMCTRAHGEPPSEYHDAAHSCHNGPGGCANPMHLRWATVSENMMDKVANGTATRGERAFGVRLTETQVLEIRSLSGETHASIAERYGVSRRAIGHVLSRATWSWLP